MRLPWAVQALDHLLLSAYGTLERPQRLGGKHLVAANDVTRYQFTGLNIAPQGRYGNLKVLRSFRSGKRFLLEMAKHLFVGEIIVAESIHGQQ